MNTTQVNYRSRSLSRIDRLKEAVIASFSEPAKKISARFGEFSDNDWDKLSLWLDASGFALYLLDRLTSSGLQCCLPEHLLSQLQQNLLNNRERTAALLKEATEIAEAFQKYDISFALLKGLTLQPDSVPDSTLRYQLDLDFLVRESDATMARYILHEFGYKLYAISGKTFEFKAGPAGAADIKNIYKIRPYRSLELHLLPKATYGGATQQGDRLKRAQIRCIRGALLPTLSPADLFMQQALHLFKHICSEYTRASWVLEYWRHVQTRRNDATFWHQVELLAVNEPNGALAIGTATMLATHAFGEFAPPELTRWSMDCLPPTVQLWIHTYGRRVLFTDVPGSKFYLLLKQELNASSITEKKMARRILFPMHLPPRIITQGESREGLLSLLTRHRMQNNFIFFRLRFHVVEGLRYVIESLRWQRRLAGITQ